MQFFKPENYFQVRKALEKAGRKDLVGSGCDCLIPDRPPREAQDRPQQERPQRGERPARGERPDRPPRSGKPSGRPGGKPAGKGGPPRGDRKPDSREEKPVNPMRGAKFKRTKLGPRKRTPIK